MKINRDNYEPFFLDYLEGNLKEEMIDQFLDFLELNPDLKEEDVVFSGKTQLYKSIADEKAALENKFVALLEGDLDEDDQKSFVDYLASQPELQKEYKQFTKTRVIPDLHVRFHDKQKLHRKSGSVIFLNWALRAAAVIVVLWGVNSLFQTGNQPQLTDKNTIVAEVNPKQSVPTEKPKETATKHVIQEKPEVRPKPTPKPEIIKEQTQQAPEENQIINTNLQEEPLALIAKIAPKQALIEPEAVAAHLAVKSPEMDEKVEETTKVMTIDQFLVSRIKKARNESILSAQRIAQAGLGIASELSGERIGYKVKDGKIASVDFESRLLAFSIPLKK
jgi:hypothetical protein